MLFCFAGVLNLHVFVTLVPITIAYNPLMEVSYKDASERSKLLMYLRQSRRSNRFPVPAAGTVAGLSMAQTPLRAALRPRSRLTRT